MDNIFPSKQALIFHANYPLWRQFAWNIKSYFPEKYFKMLSAEIFTQQSINDTPLIGLDGPDTHN